MSTNLGKCNAVSIDFIVRDTDPEMEAVEDDIKGDLAKIGIKVNSMFLNDEDYIDAELNGKYNVLFTRTWGAPYDPHSYLSSWAVPSHVEYSAIGNLQPPLTRDLLLQKIEKVQKELDPRAIQEQWREILDDVHQQALFMPLWGTRVPYVINRRLVGFVPGEQSWAFPLNNVKVVEGSTSVTVSPGAGSLFSSVGPLNPHQYSPNQLFAQDWIYEGLVSYGQDGQIVPSLASSWETESTAEGQRVTFKLRQNVTFHDGTAFNCTVAKLNFDHVLSDIVKKRHQWYGAPQHLKSWVCNDAGDFVLETTTPFYPLLQELTYIRPLRFASASAFAKGVDSNPDLHNSCEPGGFGEKWNYLEDNVTCLGLTAPIGTGPFKYVSRETNNGTDGRVYFSRHDSYWGQVPDIQNMVLVPYADTNEVEAALLSGELDMTLGIGPLTAKQVQDIKFKHSDKFDVLHGEVLQHAILVFNGNKAPTDDIAVRRAIIHAIDKAAFLEEEFGGLEQPVTQLLPLTAPYCNIDLSPKWGFDLEKAMSINCPPSIPSNSLSAGAIAGIVVAVLFVISLVAFVANMILRERSGQPMFAPPSKEAVSA